MDCHLAKPTKVNGFKSDPETKPDPENRSIFFPIVFCRADRHTPTITKPSTVGWPTCRPSSDRKPPIGRRAAPCMVHGHLAKYPGGGRGLLPVSPAVVGGHANVVLVPLNDSEQPITNVRTLTKD
ncbi:hypothetical protein BHE74_00016318 [Ensete ventricosum]|nr:hypothetical protein GW17_00007903 [Ensete ventricosum]RWW75644.1 hypothetical protein BHE74_00016318 [Ensete ventricosum]